VCGLVRRVRSVRGRSFSANLPFAVQYPNPNANRCTSFVLVGTPTRFVNMIYMIVWTVVLDSLVLPGSVSKKMSGPRAAGACSHSPHESRDRVRDDCRSELGQSHTSRLSFEINFCHIINISLTHSNTRPRHDQTRARCRQRTAQRHGARARCVAGIFDWRAPVLPCAVRPPVLLASVPFLP
jgi:hypothetical protein